jgi:hypothetical protein
MSESHDLPGSHPYYFTDPHEPQREKNGILGRVDRVRGIVEMTSRLLVMDGGQFADFGAALELAHAELQRIREEIDETFPYAAEKQVTAS